MNMVRHTCYYVTSLTIIPFQHTTLLASLKIGMKVADVEPNINAVKDIREFLKVSNCKAIFFDPVTEIQDNLLLLRKAIPEFYECKSSFSS